ncbi:MAG: hypothetical protein IPM92_17435 [Saprospiraceae bacterium]|nr:hypothetical protein [Saprospiraceae bacterium]
MEPPLVKICPLGAEHIFKAGDHEYRLRLTNSLVGSYVDLHRDGIATAESNKTGCLVILCKRSSL